MAKTRVALSAADPLRMAGLTRILESDPEIEVLPDDRTREAEVVVLATDRVLPVTMTVLRATAASIEAPVVLIVKELSDAELLIAVQHNVAAVVPLTQVAIEALTSTVHVTANAGAVMPPNVTAQLLKRLREGFESTNNSTLNRREIEILELVSDGFDTTEIAGKLRYSERTVKNVLQGVTERLHLRNRAHAVAYAIRAGMI